MKIYESHEIMTLVFPDDIPEWPQWLTWRDIRVQYSDDALMTPGRRQMLCRIGQILYLVRRRGKAGRQIVVEQYTPRAGQTSFALGEVGTTHKKEIATIPNPNATDDGPTPDEIPQQVLDTVPSMAMRAVLGVNHDDHLYPDHDWPPF